MKYVVLVAMLLVPATAQAFDPDGHFQVMVAAAELAGYSHDEAVEIASANTAVDESAATDPFPRVRDLTNFDLQHPSKYDPLRMVSAQVDFHAFGTPTLSLDDQRAAIKQRGDELYKHAIETNDPKAFGVYQHFLDDTHSHTHGGEPLDAGLGQVMCLFHSGKGEHDEANEVRMKALLRAEVTADPAAIATFVIESARGTHLVDQLTTRPDVTRAMMRDAYDSLVKFANDTGRDLHPPVNSTEAHKILDDLVSDPEIVQWDHDKGSGVARKDFPDFSVPLNNYIQRELRDRGAEAVPPVPAYQDRQLIDVAADGSTSTPAATDMATPHGEREDRHAEQNTYEVYVGTTTLRGAAMAPTTPLQPPAALQLDAMVDSADEKGVRIRYDRDALRAAVAGAHTTSTPDPQADTIVKRVLATPRETTVALDSGLVAIPLSRITERSVLNVERVVGYVLDDAHHDVILLAIAGPSKLEVADIAAIVDAVWRRGATPLCSLDPIPGHPIEDGFHARVEGVSEHSHVGKVMLDADYDMKRINLGLLPGPNELKTVFDRQLERGTASAMEGDDDRGHLSRFWLTPIQPAPGDIQVSAGSRLVLFASRVQVKTEVMLMADDGLVGTHAADPADEDGSVDFTQRYRTIAGMHESLARLEAIFDVTLMAGLLREQVPTHPQLARIAALPVASAPHADSDYPAVRRESGGAVFVMTGGVDVTYPAARTALVPLVAGADLKSAVDSLLADRDPNALRSPGDRAFIAGLDRFWAGQALQAKDPNGATQAWTEAESSFSEAIAANESHAAAYLMRAYTRISIGTDLDGAIRDSRRVIAFRPNLARAYSYMAYAYLMKRVMGDASALEQVRVAAEAAIALSEDDMIAHAMLGLAHMVTMQRQMRFVYEDDAAKLEPISDADRATAAAAANEFDRAMRGTKDAKERAAFRTQRGWARGLSGDLASARADLPRDARDPDTLTFRAVIEYLAGNPDDAGQIASSALDLAPSSMAFQVRAASRYSAHDLPGTIADMDAAIALDPVGTEGLVDIAAKLRLMSPPQEESP